MLRLSTEAWVGSPLPGVDEFIESTTVAAVGAGDALIRPGEPHPFVYYVIQGAVRVQTRIHDNLVTTGIRLEGELVADISGLGLPFVRRAVGVDAYSRSRNLEGAASGHAHTLTTAIEPTLLLRFDGMHLRELVETHAEWERVFTGYFALHTLTTQHDFAIARSGAPADRYKALSEARPELVRRVTQREIAGLLGLTEAGLSRVVTRIHRQADAGQVGPG